MSWIHLLFCATAGFLGWGHLETWLLRLVETEFRSQKVPSSFDGYRIALLGNLHFRRHGWWTRKLQNILNLLGADILLLGGNIKPSHTADNRKIHRLLEEFLNPLHFRDGIYAVKGYRDKKGFWDNLPEDSRIVWLNNSHHLIQRENQTLAVCGIGTAHAAHLDRGANYLRETLQVVKQHEPSFTILLGQSPDLLRVAQGQPLDLILAVDTLHYSIRIPGFGVPRRDSKVPYSWSRGWLKEGTLSLYLSPGIGTRWLPFRFFLRPEITCVTLRKT